MERLCEALLEIQAVDHSLDEKIQKRLDSLTKPRGSLGRLEALAKTYCIIRGKDAPTIRRKMVVTFAGDHGVVEEGVSAYPQGVTAQMVMNFVRGGAAVTVMAKQAGVDHLVVDIGVAHDFEPCDGLHIKKVARGTKNFAKEHAMTREEAISSLKIGINLADHLCKEGVDIIGTGDMGIGNTTSSSAITAAMLSCPVRAVTGWGTGVNEETFEKKVAVISEALRRHQPDPRDPVDVIKKVGGFEIAGIAGLIIGACSHRIPVVLDGFISTTAALVAVGLESKIKEYLIASHQSAEAGHGALLENLGLDPLFRMEMRLGEGTGAVLGIYFLETAVRILTEMTTFEEAGVSGKVR